MRDKLLKGFALLGFGSVFISISFANINADEWMKTYGKGTGYCVQQTEDGGYVITGYDVGICLIKTDSFGNTLWTKNFFEDSIGGIGYYVEQTSDGGYVIACSADTGGYLLKVDSLGTLQWRKIYSFAKGLSCVKQTFDGGYITTGILKSSFHRIGVIKLDSLGDTLWTRMPPGPDGKGLWITQLPDSNYIIVGSYYGGGETWVVSLIKMDYNGNTLWIVDYEALTYGSNDYWPGCADQTLDSGYIIMGDRGIVKVDSVGNVIWEKEVSYPYDCVRQTFDSGYICIPGRNLLKLDSLGDSLWTKELSLPVESHGYYVQQTTDSGYIVTGNKWEGMGVWKVVLIKTYASVGMEETKTVEHLTAKITKITPNPVILSASIDYYIGSPSGIELGIYDVGGKLIKVLEKGEKTSGIYKVRWNINNVSSGIYFCVLKQGNLVSSKKIIVFK